jgi:hypothetical protein
MAVVRVPDFDAQRDRLREKVADDGPAFKLSQGGKGCGLLAWTVRHAIHERLHKRRPNDVHRYSPEGIRPLGKAKLTPPDLARGGGNSSGISGSR